MVAADRRRTLILSMAGNFFGVPVQDDVTPTSGSSALERFLDEATCRTICFQSANSEFGLKLSNELSAGKNALIFFKLAASTVTKENFHDLVQVVSTGSGESSTLIEALRQVWCPILESSGVSRSFLKKLKEDLLGPSPPSSIAEEEAFWMKKRDETRRSQERRVAEEASAILNRMKTELESAATSRDGLVEVEEALEVASGHLEDLWKLEGPAYSEDRMKLLLDIVGDEIVTIVESLVSDSSSSPKQTRSHTGRGVRQVHSSGTRAPMNETASAGATICEKWMSVSERLTGLFWPHQSLHPWRGPPFVPRRCAKLGKRLRQIAEFRAQHHQLTRLLTPSERAALRTDDLLRAFDDVRVSLEEDEKRDFEWNRLRREIEEGLVPAEERVAEKLRTQIVRANDPTSLVAEFRRYCELMKREGLRRALRSERETLLSSLPSLIELYRNGPDTENLLDSPRILQQFQTIRASELRLESLRKLAEDLLADLPGYQQAISMINATLKDFESRRQHLVESWINETRASIARKELSLGTDSSVVELTGASMMRVTYDMRLVTLVREARALAGQGVELPREVRDLAERASSLASRARALQQVANFHNTIGDRMVPSQRPLMLTAALELARAVREQSGVVWSDPQAVDGYTARLRELVRKFARQNTELAAKHSALRDAVVSLFKGEGSSLVENQNVWKDTLRGMRSIIDTVEMEYGNTKAWKLHWDRQLLKVLGVAYRTSLPSLMKKLPEIRVELTFRDGSLRWRPSLEEIRAKLYSGLRRFLVIPTNFRGVGDVADGNFDDLVRRSAYLYGSVYIEAEAVLSTIEATRAKWIPLAAPARFNDGERLKGKTPQDWEKAFKDAKQWAQEVGKLRGGMMKVRCITIDTGTTRNDLESASRRCWEQLSSNLRVEASSRLAAATEFLSSAARELDRRPRNVEEIGIARETHARIQQESSGIAKELEAVTGFARVLAAWTRENLEGASGASAAWEGLKDRLERHQAVMTRQLEDARINLRHRGSTVRDERERWEARWGSKPEVLTIDWITSMRERLISLIDQRKSLETDCRRIGLDISSILEEDESLAELETRLEIEESNCRFQTEFLEELHKQEAEEWTAARRRLPRLHSWLDSWELRLQDRRATEGQETETMVVDALVSKKVREVRSAVEWIQLLRGDELAEEHWIELKPILDLPVSNFRDITLGHLLSRANLIEENVERIKEVIKKATAESGIRQALSELETWESSASLNLRETKDSRNTVIFLVGEYGGLLSRAGELRLLIEGARGTVGYERFADRATRCEAALSELEERIKILNALQRKWVYLEPVYGGGAAPNDSGRWARADKEFRYVMGEIARDPGMASLRRLPLPALISLKDLLDRCQRSLDEFLEEKRSSYPRLYFLSDEDLLELVSGNGRGLDAHLPKLFHGIGSVQRESGLLTAVISPEGESLKLPEPIDLNDPLSRWLSDLEKGMRDALRRHLEDCLSDSLPDPSRYPAQVLLLSERIHFTERCETALKGGHSSLRNLVETLETQRAKYRGLENASDKLTVLKARGLLLDTVHHLGVARTLLEIVARGEKPFWAWSRQLRSYRSQNRGPIIRCAGAEFQYRFEYQGAGAGLVRTPLTERCFLALTQGMKLGLGGSPTGPAGTGKTESVKALGAMLGRLVLIFNCDEGMDAGSMRRILGGLAQAGAWGCFDEFNRLEEETLSALAMLVRPLQEAIRDGKSEVQLSDRKITLNPHCCVFITMNPANAEYGGRHKLPDSLARLFRPVAMAQPDKSDIAKALLECAGFLEASALSKRLVEILDILEKLLFEQPHYDWGLRALKSILDAIPASDSSEPASEIVRLLAAIRASTLPKLTEEDTPKFLTLLSDVFPEVNTSAVLLTERRDLRSTLDELCAARNLENEVTSRCIQLWDQLQSRTGVAIVGPSGSGKSLIRGLLADALIKLGEPVTQFLVYPGAIPKTRLLGRVDPRTREWKEGLLPLIVSSANESATWIVLDGNVEPGWAEALNSALDDNRLLTLSNGVSVRLRSSTRFIFETNELDGASPATVSRLGIVHLGSTTPSALFVPSKLDVLPPLARDIVSTCLDSGFDFVLKNNEDRSSASGLMTAIMAHLQRVRTQTMATYAVLASLCGQIGNSETRDGLARLIYQLTDCWCPDPQRPFDSLYNAKTDRLEPFRDVVQSIDSDNGSLLRSGPIKRALATISPWIEDGCPVIVRGPAGCGKSSLVATALSGRESSTVLWISSIYGTQDLISRLKRACVPVDSSFQGRTYRPRNGGRLILVIEDLHLASKDLQEFIRQLLQQEGFHEEDLEFARVTLTVVCTADATTKLNSRLEALLATHYLPNPSLNDTVAIVELHLRSALKNSSVNSWISRAAPAMVEAFGSVSSVQKTPLVPWTTRDLALWADALKCYPTPENDVEITRHLLDSGRRLFHSRLTVTELSRWESIITSRIPGAKGFGHDIYVWKGGSVGLSPFTEEQWTAEVQAGTAKCAREGELIEAPMSTHLLQIVAGVSWALGSGLQHGLILIGRAGTGRRSATKLAAAISSLRVVDSGPGRGRAAIKIAVQAAGIDGEPTLLLLEEHHIREEGLAILTNALASKGELPGLLTSEELDGLVAPLTDLARREDFTGTLEQYLYHRLRNLLRVVTILDVLNENLPSCAKLMKQCIHVGFERESEWWILEKSLMELAILRKNKVEDSAQEEKILGVEAAVKAHLRAPPQQQAPARFLALLHVWEDLKERWTKEIQEQLTSFEAGIDKLREAGERVAKLENEASKQRQELEVEKGRATAALEKITATMRGATGQRGEMSTLKAETERESAELARRKADIEGELGKVEPLVEQAAQAVAGIGADALAEVRSLRAPPAAVRDVLEGVLRLMGIRDTSWNSMKTFLAKRGVKDEIRTWDARRSSAASLEAVAKLIKERPDSFEERTAKRASVAAAPLAAWVLANLQYGQILQQVAPLEREQRLLAERLSIAEAQIGRLEAGLNSVEDRVAQLQQELAEHSRGAAALQLRTETTEANLATSRALLHKLDKEHSDWQAQCERLTTRKTKLDVEAANAAALLVYQYLGRKEKWKKLALDLLTNERETLLWRAQGLPGDTESLLGAACALNGPLVPLFVDATGVAVNWLKSHVGPVLEVTEPEESRFLTSLELAVRFGKPLLVQELVELPSVLLPLLRRRPLRLGDRTLIAQQGFKLFLATRRDSLERLPSEADSVIFNVTFGASVDSLAERFVEKALLRETPELEGRRREALEQEEKLAGERDLARQDLLAQLGAARSQDLLQEAQEPQGGLLSSLEATQSKAREISLALEKSRQGLEEVTKRARKQEPLARFAARLFEAVKALILLSPLYVFSVEAFTDLYLEAADASKSIQAEMEADENHRISVAQKKLTALTIHHCTKAAYRKHRLPVALHLAMSLHPESETETKLLLGEGMTNKDGNLNFNVPHWVPEERRSTVNLLCRALPQVGSRLKPAWLENIGNIYADNNLTSFQKVLVVQALRPDHLHTALSKMAADQLGVRDVAPPSWSLAKVAENARTCPVLLLLSPGADPSPELSALAACCTSGPMEFTEVSLGQGQLTQAETALETAYKNGGWLLLSNLQLALNWLPRLEGLLRSQMCTGNKNANTRIWLTTEECPNFYPGLAGFCTKLAYEPPEGVKRNIKRSLQQLKQLPNSGRTNRTLLLAWLHAVLQERRRFVPQSWTRAYEWNEADLEAAVKLIVVRTADRKNEMELESKGDVEADRGLLDVAVYGGRLQDAYDMRAFQSILRDVWSKDVFDGRRKLGGVLALPEASSGDSARAVERLSDLDSPRDYFGLPLNIHGAWERESAETALALLKAIERGDADDRKEGTNTQFKAELQRELKDLVDRGIPTIDSSIPITNQKASPLDRFIADEIGSARRLLNLVQTELNALKSSEIDAFSQTPKHWLTKWPGAPRGVIPFVRILVSRNAALTSIRSSTNSKDSPYEVDLSWLARPRALLAALKQQAVQQSSCSLENLRLRVDWTMRPEKTNKWSPSVIIKGLLISGAAIQNGTLTELDANAAPIAAVPACQVTFVPEGPGEQEERERRRRRYPDVNDEEDRLLEIPVYADSRRNILICSLPIDCPREDRDVWLRRGVALYLRSSWSN